MGTQQTDKSNVTGADHSKVHGTLLGSHRADHSPDPELAAISEFMSGEEIDLSGLGVTSSLHNLAELGGLEGWPGSLMPSHLMSDAMLSVIDAQAA